MAVYITTSKNPSQKTKTLCKAFSKLLPGSLSENRGRKSIEQIFMRAKLLGKSRVMLVYETDGLPSRICFMKVKAHSWEWAGAEIAISKFRVFKIPTELPDEITANGPRGKEFDVLFDFDKPEGEDFIELRCERKNLSFVHRGKKLMELVL